MFVEVHPTVLGGNALVYRIGSTDCLGVPLLIKGHLTGAITIRAERDRKYGSIDLELVEELGRRAAMAIDNARLYRHAEEALRARDEFLSIAAHEIRGPITSIHLAVQALLQKKLPPDALSRAFELVEREDRRLSRFVDELLDLGRLRAGRLQLQLEEVNLTDVVQEVVKRVGAELATSGSSLTITPQPSVIGEWDKFRMEQMVTNLLSNAIKFGLGKPIEISVSSFEGRARLTVRDHGIGIEPPLESASSSPSSATSRSVTTEGWASGFTSSRRSSARWEARCASTSELGAGSTFTVELPLQRSESAHAHPDR